jgi:peptide/nickel transport system permease protein
MSTALASAPGLLLSDWRGRHQSSIEEARHSVRIFFRDRLAAFGLLYIVLMIAVAVLAPVVAPYPDQGRGVSNIATRFDSPSAQHPFGTDNFGRDVLSRVVYGTRTALVMPAIVAVGIVLVGVPLGGIAGYFGGWLDEVVMRITDVFLAFPGLILAMALVAYLGPGLRNVAIALVVTWWPWYARLVRGQAISLRQRPYVMAARTMGVRNSTIILRHILPNAMGPVVVQMSLDVGAVILEVAAMSFIGLGALPPTSDWGLMISEGRIYILEQWWIAVSPGLAIFALVLAFNFVGDGLRDVLDPRSRR